MGLAKLLTLKYLNFLIRLIRKIKCRADRISFSQEGGGQVYVAVTKKIPIDLYRLIDFFA